MRKIALSLAITTLALAQVPDSEKKVEFEVASIRPAVQDNDHDSNTDNGRYRTHNLTLKRLITIAYGIDIREISGGPGWVDSDSYDINAKIPEQFAQNRTRDTVPRMVQSLLADRFQLVIHREANQISGYELVIAKKGPKIGHANPDVKNSNMHSKNTHLTAENVTMEAFSKNLSRNSDIGKLVVDKTGLTGGFNFELDWAPERPESASDDRPSIFTAVQEQLGLKLEPAKVPILTIVIDRAEKPEAN